MVVNEKPDDFSFRPAAQLGFDRRRVAVFKSKIFQEET